MEVERGQEKRTGRGMDAYENMPDVDGLRPFGGAGLVAGVLGRSRFPSLCAAALCGFAGVRFLALVLFLACHCCGFRVPRATCVW